MSESRINLQNTPEIDGAVQRAVRFERDGVQLEGTLYLPAEASGALPAVVVTGAWTCVKEQMAGTYARELAARGYAALAFDFSGWGASGGEPRFVEDPAAKTADIEVAARFLASLPEVDGARVFGLGICASSGYMASAAADSEQLSKVALVAPWLHTPKLAEDIYGGADAAAKLIAAGRAAEQSAEPQLLVAASTEDDSALMFQAPYYTEPDRGLIDAYDNRFNVASWEPWLRYDGQASAERLDAPLLIVCSDAAALPAGARAYAKRTQAPVQQLWLDDIVQFDFYDRADVVEQSADAVAAHFASTAGVQARIPSTPDEAAITTVVESVASLADRGNFEALEQLYADPVRVDYTSLSGGEIEDKSPQQLMRQWAGVLPGFDRTRHNLANIAVTIDGRTAVATADVTASHWLDDRFWEVSGDYRFELRAGDDGEWLITGHTFNLQVERGSRDVFGPASERASAAPVPYLVRRQTAQAVRDFLSALEDKNMTRLDSLWAEDAVQDMPFSPEGFPKRVVGREQLIAHYAAWPDNSGEADFTAQLVLYPLQDPERIFAEFKGDVAIVPTGRRYQQTYGGLFHVVDGQIKLFREYYDPAPFKYAFGLDEGGRFHA